MLHYYRRQHFPVYLKDIFKNLNEFLLNDEYVSLELLFLYKHL